ncbi:MAG: hypothetical protein LBC61_03785 [Candidatus Peribacteria bacterium]|nr:hypothetical protein [Candidatus Peribacteria bacterium]
MIISFILLSHKEFFSIFKELWEIEFKIPKDDLWQAKLVLKEFFYLIAFIVL